DARMAPQIPGEHLANRELGDLIGPGTQDVLLPEPTVRPLLGEYRAQIAGRRPAASRRGNITYRPPDLTLCELTATSSDYLTVWVLARGAARRQRRRAGVPFAQTIRDGPDRNHPAAIRPWRPRSLARLVTGL